MSVETLSQAARRELDSALGDLGTPLAEAKAPLSALLGASGFKV